jgi:hypothetical protein
MEEEQSVVLDEVGFPECEDCFEVHFTFALK